jgi:hypothetical protein
MDVFGVGLACVALVLIVTVAAAEMFGDDEF